MATPNKKKVEAPSTRIAARPQSERRVDAPSTPSRGSLQVSYEAISQRAFEIWDRNGRQPGRDLENWLQAESELRGS